MSIGDLNFAAIKQRGMALFSSLPYFFSYLCGSMAMARQPPSNFGKGLLGHSFPKLLGGAGSPLVTLEKGSWGTVSQSY